YKAFARREGILFDRDGLPHETRDGEIVTSGSFDRKETDVLRSEYRPPQPSFKPDFAAASEGDIAAALMPVPAAEPGALETVTDLLARRDKAREFLQSLDKALDFWREGMSHPFDEKIIPYIYEKREWDNYFDKYKFVKRKEYQTYYDATRRML